VYCKGCDVLSMIKRCKGWNIATVDRDWADRKVLFVVYLAKVLRWLKVHSKFAMSGAPQVAMHFASQSWQIFFPSQTLQVICFSFAKPLDFLFGPLQKGTICSSGSHFGSWSLESSKKDCRGQNPLDWEVLYIIRKILELRCLKWAYMTHLDP
jgi:hypothetical protein